MCYEGNVISYITVLEYHIQACRKEYKEASSGRKPMLEQHLMITGRRFLPIKKPILLPCACIH